MQTKAKILRDLFCEKTLIRIVGAHDGLGAKLIEKNLFDGVWASGLEISTSHAVPDANILTMTDALNAAITMNDATLLPVLCDCDTGFGNVSNVRRLVRKFEAAGIAGVVIEDKLFPKVNSFVPGRQELASMEEFMGKIEAAKNTQANPDFMVFARVEALIAGWGMIEALKRAYAYAEAGADGIVIHSKASTPDEIFEFAKKWKGAQPLVAIPTTYPSVTTDELASRGFGMVIYANHGLRASISAMDQVLKSIQETGSTAFVENKIASMREVFEIQGMQDLNEDEKKYSKKETIQAVIPAAGDPRFQADLEKILEDRPLCMLDLGGKSLLERQTDALRSCGVNDIVVVGGYLADRIQAEGTTVLRNPDYQKSGNAHSILLSRPRWKDKCVVLYSDIVFDRNILERLLDSPHAITLVIDRAYQTLPFRDKRLDLVVAENSSSPIGRKLEHSLFKPVRKIGGCLDKREANYEFIGLAYFRAEGLCALAEAWEEAKAEFKNKPFYESPSVEKADFNDLIQYLIDRGEPVVGLEIEHGWSEIHSLADYERVSSHFKKYSKKVSID